MTITHESSLSVFEEQILYALQSFDGNIIPSENIANIVLCGLGGSGIGGRIARGFFLDKANCPVEVCSDYFLPAYIGSDTLVILSSYSGNTEETLAMFDTAEKAGCKIVGICSGGELAQKLKTGNFPYFTVPTGYQPRMALGFSLALNLQIVGKVFGYDVKTELKEALAVYNQKEALKQEARNLVEQWNKTASLPFIVFADEFYAGVATRFCQQIQENAKGQAFPLILPECNHNATEFIYGNINANILLLNSGKQARNNKRLDFLNKLLSDNGNKTVSISPNGANLPELLKTIYILDWVSVLLSDTKQVNNMQVQNIDKLKNYLANQ